MVSDKKDLCTAEPAERKEEEAGLVNLIREPMSEDLAVSLRAWAAMLPRFPGTPGSFYRQARLPILPHGSVGCGKERRRTARGLSRAGPRSDGDLNTYLPGTKLAEAVGS